MFLPHRLLQSHQTWLAGKSPSEIKVLMGKTSINQDFHLPSLNTGYNLDFWHGWNISVVEGSSKSHCCQPCSTQWTDPKSRDVSQFTAIEMRIYMKRFQSFGIGGRKICDNSTSFPSGSQWWNTRWRTVLEDVIASTQLCNPKAGSRVPRLQCYQARFQGFAGFQDSTVAGFQDCKVADFESYKVPTFRITGVLGFQVSRVQGSKHQGSRLVRVLVWFINNEVTSAMQSKRKTQ